MHLVVKLFVCLLDRLRLGSYTCCTYFLSCISCTQPHLLHVEIVYLIHIYKSIIQFGLGLLQKALVINETSYPGDFFHRTVYCEIHVYVVHTMNSWVLPILLGLLVLGVLLLELQIAKCSECKISLSFYCKKIFFSQHNSLVRQVDILNLEWTLYLVASNASCNQDLCTLQLRRKNLVSRNDFFFLKLHNG